jgi:hypothetical protein
LAGTGQDQDGVRCAQPSRVPRRRPLAAAARIAGIPICKTRRRLPDVHGKLALAAAARPIQVNYFVPIRDRVQRKCVGFATSAQISELGPEFVLPAAIARYSL